MADPAPRISVVIPVRNEAASLPGLLAQLLEQEYPPECFEILVADGGSTDGTRAVVDAVAQAANREARARVRLIANPGRRSGAGRNAGIRAAEGEVILFIDGHCRLPSRRLLADTARLLEETGAECLCRPQPLRAPSSTHTGRLIAAARAAWLGHGRDSMIYDLSHAGFVDPASSGATYRREVFDRVGLYDESFDACEDVELNTRVARAGLKAYTHPALAVYYEPRSSLYGLWRQMLRYGRGRTRLFRKHPGAWSPAQMAPAVLLLSGLAAMGFPPALALAPLGAVATGLAAVVSLPAAVFALAALVCSAQLAARRAEAYGVREGLATLVKAPAVFAVIYGGLGAGLLLEALLRGSPRRGSRPQPSPALVPGPGSGAGA